MSSPTRFIQIFGGRSSLAQGAYRRCPDRTAGAPGARDSIHPIPHPQSVCVMYGPLDDGGIPEECHRFLRAIPEVLQRMYVVKVPVYL